MRCQSDKEKEDVCEVVLNSCIHGVKAICMHTILIQDLISGLSIVNSHSSFNMNTSNILNF